MKEPTKEQLQHFVDKLRQASGTGELVKLDDDDPESLEFRVCHVSINAAIDHKAHHFNARIGSNVFIEIHVREPY